MKKSLILLVILFVVAGCAAETAVSDPTLPAASQIPPTDIPPTEVVLAAPVVETAVATEVVVETAVVATEAPVPSPTPEEITVEVISGRTPEGAYFLGSPDAPLTLIDYSDFL